MLSEIYIPIKVTKFYLRMSTREDTMWFKNNLNKLNQILLASRKKKAQFTKYFPKALDFKYFSFCNVQNIQVFIIPPE